MSIQETIENMGTVILAVSELRNSVHEISSDEVDAALEQIETSMIVIKEMANQN